MKRARSKKNQENMRAKRDPGLMSRRQVQQCPCRWVGGEGGGIVHLSRGGRASVITQEEGWEKPEQYGGKPCALQGTDETYRMLEKGGLRRKKSGGRLWTRGELVLIIEVPVARKVLLGRKNTCSSKKAQISRKLRELLIESYLNSANGGAAHHWGLLYASEEYKNASPVK